MLLGLYIIPSKSSRFKVTLESNLTLCLFSVLIFLFQYIFKASDQWGLDRRHWFPCFELSLPPPSPPSWPTYLGTFEAFFDCLGLWNFDSNKIIWQSLKEMCSVNKRTPLTYTPKSVLTKEAWCLPPSRAYIVSLSGNENRKQDLWNSGLLVKIK